MRSGKSSARTALRLHSGILRLLRWYTSNAADTRFADCKVAISRDSSLLNFASCESFFLFFFFFSNTRFVPSRLLVNIQCFHSRSKFYVSILSLGVDFETLVTLPFYNITIFTFTTLFEVTLISR